MLLPAGQYFQCLFFTLSVGLLTLVGSTAQAEPHSSVECGTGVCKVDESDMSRFQMAADAYQQSFIDKDFSCLEQASSQGYYFGDGLKRLRACENWVVDLRGEYRLRFS